MGWRSTSSLERKTPENAPHRRSVSLQVQNADIKPKQCVQISPSVDVSTTIPSRCTLREYRGKLERGKYNNRSPIPTLRYLPVLAQNPALYSEGLTRSLNRNRSLGFPPMPLRSFDCLILPDQEHESSRFLCFR